MARRTSGSGCSAEDGTSSQSRRGRAIVPCDDARADLLGGPTPTIGHVPSPDWPTPPRRGAVRPALRDRQQLQQPAARPVPRSHPDAAGQGATASRTPKRSTPTPSRPRAPTTRACSPTPVRSGSHRPSRPRSPSWLPTTSASSSSPCRSATTIAALNPTDGYQATSTPPALPDRETTRGGAEFLDLSTALSEDQFRDPAHPGPDGRAVLTDALVAVLG